MAERSVESIGLTILTIAEVPNFFSGLLPSLFTIGHFSTDESGEAVYWIRRGEVNATRNQMTIRTIHLALDYLAVWE